MSATRGYSMQHLPTAGRWSVYIALAVVFAIACAFLSHWQFARNEERSGQLALVESNYDARAVPLAEAIPSDGAFRAEDEWLPVTIRGTYLAEDTVLARNRAHGGTSAFEVLVPFRAEDGRVLIVDRGWVPPGNEQAEPDEISAPPSGDANITVRLRPGEPLPSSGRSAPEGQVPTIHVPLIAAGLGPDENAVIPDVYGLLAAEDPAPATAPQPLSSPSEDPGPHLSYAIQWILFAIMGFVFIGYVIRTERRHRREEREDADLREAGRPTPSRVRRRKDRDADDEDAILDEVVGAHRR